MLGFIGGSGIYDALPLSDTREVTVETPFGQPSAPITIGTFDDTSTEIAFLPRHGRDHELDPTHVPYRANIYALKSLGVERILSSNAVGSLREDLPPRTLVVPDQLFDRTRNRTPSFFGDGVVVHTSFGEPYCPHMVAHLGAAADVATDADSVTGGTYVCIEGPQFSTRAESEFYRGQDWDIVGMTAVPEAKLAREAELCYATVAGVTDYDVWKSDSEVTLGEVLENADANETAIKAVIEHAIRELPATRECGCGHAIADAINTPSDAIPADKKESLSLLIREYV